MPSHHDTTTSVSSPERKCESHYSRCSVSKRSSSTANFLQGLTKQKAIDMVHAQMREDNI